MPRWGNEEKAVMNYPFAKLEKLAEETILLLEQKNNKTKLAALLQEAAAEAKHCRTYYLQHLYAAKSKKQQKAWITATVTAATNINNHFFKVQQFINRQSATLTVLTEMEKLIEFLAAQFPFSFNRHHAAPLHYVQQQQKEILPYYVQCKAALQKEQPEEKAWKFLWSAADSILQSTENSSPTFHDLFYMRDLLKEIPAVSKIISTELFSSAEIFLMTHGFNEEQFVAYLLQKMQDAVIADPKQYFEEQRKYLVQLSVQEKGLFRSNKKSCFNILIRYANTELRFSCKSKHANTGSQSMENEKIFISSLPVGQIAIILRLLVEGGHIKPINLKLFLQKMSAMMGTENKSMISAESLRNKYYSPERPALQAVKDIFFGCIKNMKRLEG